MTSLSGFLVNRLRRIVDKYDGKNGLRKREVFACSNIQRRNEHRREDFRLNLEEAQCPVYLDNRCCGSCDLAPTCDYAVACNCFGYTKGALGGTDERYYMRNHDYAKHGRIAEDGKFDWDYFKLNHAKERFEVGRYIVVKELIHSSADKELNDYLQEHSIIIGEVKKELSEEGLLSVNFSIANQQGIGLKLIHYRDIQYGSAYGSFETAKRFL